ncbi:hypothetical protein BRD11_06675 [Halobacteriales archaeon SW_12_69_24]|nr:MAG: hypothetical protein BRD11_06675 [Halobacteriales archaeon SW_12_69_24]
MLSGVPARDSNMPAPPQEETDGQDPRSARWAELRLANGETVIYDTEEPTAWIQSKGAVDLEALV